MLKSITVAGDAFFIANLSMNAFNTSINPLLLPTNAIFY